jgi:hypothetical protein
MDEEELLNIAGWLVDGIDEGRKRRLGWIQNEAQLKDEGIVGGTNTSAMKRKRSRFKLVLGVAEFLFQLMVTVEHWAFCGNKKKSQAEHNLISLCRHDFENSAVKPLQVYPFGIRRELGTGSRRYSISQKGLHGVPDPPMAFASFTHILSLAYRLSHVLISFFPDQKQRSYTKLDPRCSIGILGYRHHNNS